VDDLPNVDFKSNSSSSRLRSHMRNEVNQNMLMMILINWCRKNLSVFY